MRSSVRFILWVLLLLLPIVASAQRARRGNTPDPSVGKGEGLSMSRDKLADMRNNNQDKNSEQLDVYMFAAAFSVLDSILFISDIEQVNNVTINNKWFIKDRLVFEKQFTDHVGSQAQDESILTAVYFSEDRKKMEKTQSKIKKRNSKKNCFELRSVNDFHFDNNTTELTIPQYVRSGE